MLRHLFVAVLLVATLAAQQVRADDADPVTDLQAALTSVTSSLDYTPAPATVKAYAKRVKAALDKLSSPSDLCRALLLPPMNEDRNDAIEKVRQDAAEQIVERALRGLRA